MPEKESFVNEATRRFYEHFKNFIEESTEQRDRFYKAFELADRSNPYTFMSQLKTRSRSITIDQVYKARDVFGLNPGYLFEVNDQEQLGVNNTVEEIPVLYGTAEERKSVGAQLHDLFKRHQIKIEHYAQTRLSISKQALYDKLSGKSRIYFDEVLRICEDTGESLDQFRTAPLPKGHYLQQIETLKKLNEQLEQELLQLKKNL
jgi:hypothetical protein